ncbi:hypothetical protein U1Q18_019685 [Sarracenia purpurea var. burkii]
MELYCEMIYLMARSQSSFFRRIKTPVKGHSCKHLQCFDFDNFVDINSRRPSWRCPHCNQCICYVDIRVDQNMVLKEVGENVVDVIISADGSWKAVMDSDDNTEQPRDKTMNSQQDVSVQQNASNVSIVTPDIFDLTEGDDEMNVVHTSETQDRKPILDNLQNQPSIRNVTIPVGMNSTSELNQYAVHIEDDFWTGMFLSTCGSVSSGPRSDAQMVGGVSGSAPTNFMLSPVLTDAVSPALNREPEPSRESALVATSMLQSQTSASSNLSLQQSQIGNSIASNEYGRIPSMPRHVNRTPPIAVQALPAQTPTPVPQQRSRNSFNTLISQGPSVASQTSAMPSVTDGFNTISASIERQRQYSRSHLNPLQASQMPSTSLQHQSTTQNWNHHQDRSFISSQAAQQIIGLQALYRASSSAPSTEHQNTRQQQPLNARLPHVMSHSPSQIRSSAQPSSHSPRNQIPQGGTQSGVVPTALHGSSQRLMASAQRAAQIGRQPPSVPVPLQTTRAPPSFPVNVSGFRASVGDQRGTTVGTTSQSATTAADVLAADLPGEQNWRPTGRMRGSLSGRAYSAALNQYIIQPTQPVQPARPPLNMTSPPPGIPSPLHVLRANNRNANASQVTNSPPTEPTTTNGGSSVLPEMSSGMC